MVCLDPAGTFRTFKDKSSVLTIRLARMGARKQPYYRVVVIEKAQARNGRPVEVVGTYNPRTNPMSLDLKRERIDYWVSKGAQLIRPRRKAGCKTCRACRCRARSLNLVLPHGAFDDLSKPHDCSR